MKRTLFAALFLISTSAIAYVLEQPADQRPLLSSVTGISGNSRLMLEYTGLIPGQTFQLRLSDQSCGDAVPSAGNERIVPLQANRFGVISGLFPLDVAGASVQSVSIAPTPAEVVCLAVSNQLDK